MNKPYYITTPIYYPSGKLHIGNAYTTVACDAIARYKRMCGYDVFYLTGTDEHGQKIETRAKEAGVTPKEFVDTIVDSIKELWSLLDISYDKFIRTTDDYHEQAVQKIFKDLYDKGDIYKGEYSGMYCIWCEAFWTETQLKDGKCPDCSREIQHAKEEAYFFRLSKYSDKLLELYENNPDFIQPVSRKNEMINNFIKPGLEDLCVSRTTFTWGIPVDFDPGHVVYVWIDALSNYITALGYGTQNDELYNKFWPADLHVVGKEIVRFHTIIWPAMLMALGLPLPKKVVGHGWLVGVSGDKMSKSKGGALDPIILCEKFSVDAIRYFLLRELSFGADATYSNEALISRINSDLANDLGNLVSRTSAMVNKYFGGTLPIQRTAGEIDEEISQFCTQTVTEVEQYMDKLELSSALVSIWKLIARSNKYIDQTTPWILGKDETQAPRLAAVLYTLCETVRVIAVLIAPFLPQTSDSINKVLNINEKAVWNDCKTFGKLPVDSKINATQPLFPRIDTEVVLAELNNAQQSSIASVVVQDDAKKVEGVTTIAEIGIETFLAVELRVCKVTACEPIKKAKKLLKLTLDDGTEVPRTVASGIALYYTPEQLIGKHVVVVSNLKPAVLCGVESQGMILAADTAEGGVKVLFVDDLPVGSRLR